MGNTLVEVGVAKGRVGAVVAVVAVVATGMIGMVGVAVLTEAQPADITRNKIWIDHLNLIIVVPPDSRYQHFRRPTVVLGGFCL